MVIIIMFFYFKCVCSGLMVLNALDSGSSVVSMNPARNHFVISLVTHFTPAHSTCTSFAHANYELLSVFFLCHV